jgi:magnesium chelatase family protein
MELQEIWGNEHAKRATQIAEAGQLSITYVGNGEAEMFCQYCRERGITVYAFKPCPCGNLDDNERACECSPSVIKRHRQQMSATPTDLTVTTQRCRLTASGDSLNKLKLPYKLDRQTRDLLASVTRHLALGQLEILRALKVAQTIARLGGYAEVKAAHLAEALQYRPSA